LQLELAATERVEEAVVEGDAVMGDEAIEGMVEDRGGGTPEPTLEVDAGKSLTRGLLKEMEHTAVQFAQGIGG
jgi:hypothetical protein